MRVMKFISLAVILVAVSTFTTAQEAAPTTTLKHVPITNTPVELGQANVQQLLRRVPWQRWQGQRPGRLSHEDTPGRSDSSGEEK